LDGALIIPLSLPLVDGEDSRLLLGLLSEYSIRGVHVHHSAWLYHRLAWLKAMNPILTVVDSLHIVEWRTGGFVEMAIKLSNLIDIHHVISPQLRDYMILNRDIQKERVVLAPLCDLSATESDVGQKSNPSNPFTVAFVGRLSQQKRPYLFLKYASRLRKIAGDRVRFIVHGDGLLGNETERLIMKYGLNSCLELRRPPRSVDETLTESDLLVISSDNEGLTLTSFEATARNVAVLSTDVGSQASIVAREALVSRRPLEFVGEAVSKTLAIMESEDLRQRIIGEQREKITALRALPEAHAWLESVYEGWMK